MRSMTPHPRASMTPCLNRKRNEPPSDLYANDEMALYTANSDNRLRIKVTIQMTLSPSNQAPMRRCRFMLLPSDMFRGCVPPT